MLPVPPWALPPPWAGPGPIGDAAPPPPVPGTPRDRSLRQWRDDQMRGRWNQRLRVFLFDQLTAPSRTQTQTVKVNSIGGRYVRLVAMRGTLAASSASLQGDELSHLRLRILLNGSSDLIARERDNFLPPEGNGQTVAFASLFGGDAEDPNGTDAPMYWFAAPPRLLTSDALSITVTSTVNRGEGTPTLAASLALMFVDADLYESLYDDVSPEWSPWEVAEGGET